MKTLSIILIASMIVAKLYLVVYLLMPESKDIKLNLFLDKSYNEKITVLWYIYEQMQILIWAIWAFVIYRSWRIISPMYAKIPIVLIIYYIGESFMYAFNRNTTVWADVIWTGLAVVTGFSIALNKFKMKAIR